VFSFKNYLLLVKNASTPVLAGLSPDAFSPQNIDIFVISETNRKEEDKRLRG